MRGREAGPLTWFGGDLDERRLRRAMTDEGRVIYDFDVHRAYGMHE